MAEPDGGPTPFEINLRQRMSAAIEGLGAIGNLDDLAGGASLADVISKVNAILALVRAIP
jgi:hypothetical protein